MAGHAKADRWQPPARAIAKLDADGLLSGPRGWRRATVGERHLLPDQVARVSVEETAAPGRIGLRFEGGVGPVPLVLELERVPCEIEANRDVVRELSGEASTVGKIGTSVSSAMSCGATSAGKLPLISPCGGGRDRGDRRTRAFRDVR